MHIGFFLPPFGHCHGRAQPSYTCAHRYSKCTLPKAKGIHIQNFCRYEQCDLVTMCQINVCCLSILPEGVDSTNALADTWNARRSVSDWHNVLQPHQQRQRAAEMSTPICQCSSPGTFLSLRSTRYDSCHTNSSPSLKIIAGKCSSPVIHFSAWSRADGNVAHLNHCNSSKRRMLWMTRCRHCPSHN